MTITRRYCREKRDAVMACVLDDITLLYHRASGQTHMVISPVPEILDVLDETDPATSSEVHDRLSRRYDVEQAADALPVIEGHLAELAGLGLVRSL